MELFVLLFFSTICLWILYRWKQDILCPSIVFTLGYIVTFICGIYNYHKWGSEISFIVVIAVIVGLLSFYLSDFLVQKMRKENKHHSEQAPILYQLKNMYISPRNMFFILAIIVSLVSTILLIQDVIRIASINYRDWGNLIYNYRHNRSISKIETIPRLGNLVTTSIAYCYVFVFVNNLYCKGKITYKTVLKNIVFLIPAILYSVQGVFLGGRIGIVILLIELLVIVGILRKFYSGKNITINIKSLISVILALVLFSSFFFRVQEFVGRDQDSDGAIDYITTYLGASMELFSLYVNDLHVNVDEVETLSGVVDNAQRYLGIFNSVTIRINSEFRQSNTGIELGNVYSGFRKYYNDFGFVGVIIFSFLFGFLFNVMYYSIRLYRRLNKRKLVLLLFYSSYFYCVVFHFFTDYFFPGISINMLIKLIGIAIVSGIIYRGKL